MKEKQLCADWSWPNITDYRLCPLNAVGEFSEKKSPSPTKFPDYAPVHNFRNAARDST